MTNFNMEKEFFFNSLPTKFVKLKNKINIFSLETDRNYYNIEVFLDCNFKKIQFYSPIQVILKQTHNIESSAITVPETVESTALKLNKPDSFYKIPESPDFSNGYYKYWRKDSPKKVGYIKVISNPKHHNIINRSIGNPKINILWFIDAFSWPDNKGTMSNIIVKTNQDITFRYSNSVFRNINDFYLSPANIINNLKIYKNGNDTEAKIDEDYKLVSNIYFNYTIYFTKEGIYNYYFYGKKNDCDIKLSRHGIIKVFVDLPDPTEAVVQTTAAQTTAASPQTTAASPKTTAVAPITTAVAPITTDEVSAPIIGTLSSIGNSDNNSNDKITVSRVLRDKTEYKIGDKIIIGSGNSSETRTIIDIIDTIVGFYGGYIEKFQGNAIITLVLDKPLIKTHTVGATPIKEYPKILDIKVHLYDPRKIGKHEQDDNNKGKNQILIKWDRITDIVTQYVLVIYINNAGPFLKIFKTTDANDDNLKVNFDSMEFVYDIKNNVTYKFIVYGIDNNNNISKTHYPNGINGIKQVKFSEVSNNVNKNTDSFESKILCNANGKHKIISSKKCTELSDRLDENSIIAKDTINSNCMDDENIQCFNTDNYDSLMQNLNKTNPVQIKLTI